MLIPHKKQADIIRSIARYKPIRAGRKGGKTALEVEIISYKAVVSATKLNLSKTTFTSGRKIIYIAPTQVQARDIVWASFKNRLHGIGKFNEQRLEIQVPNEDGLTTTIMIGGWENRENYRGLTDVIHITFDEIDTLKDFFINWQDIFRPMFLDTGGTADFVGTPKKESGNLKRLEKLAETDPSYECFHFTSKDNPHLSRAELDLIEKEYADNPQAYRQEILAEHIDNKGALFNFSALVDVFSNTIVKTLDKYLIIDVSGVNEGNDKTKFSYWEGLEEYRRETYEGLNQETLVQTIREKIAVEKIPMSHVLIDAVGIGEFVAASPLLDGCVAFKSSYAAFKTDTSIVLLPNVGYTKEAPKVSDYKNLRSQCTFLLSEKVNNHKIASRVVAEQKEAIIEELSNYQDVSKGDGKREVTAKEDIKKAIGHSPDDSDTWIMRMYFEIRNRLQPDQTESMLKTKSIQDNQFAQRRYNFKTSSTR